MKSDATNSSSSTSAPAVQTLLVRPSLRLDEWKEPSQEALSGGRGMFCIVPLAKALLNKASESVNFVANTTLKVMERPELLSPKLVQATLSHQLHETASSIKQAGLVLMTPKRNSSSESTS